jgi:hypothetical protein
MHRRSSKHACVQMFSVEAVLWVDVMLLDVQGSHSLVSTL